jgi:hypothetical protein
MTYAKSIRASLSRKRWHKPSTPSRVRTHPRAMLRCTLPTERKSDEESIDDALRALENDNVGALHIRDLDLRGTKARFCTSLHTLLALPRRGRYWKCAGGRAKPGTSAWEALLAALQAGLVTGLLLCSSFPFPNSRSHPVRNMLRVRFARQRDHERSLRDRLI